MEALVDYPLSGYIRELFTSGSGGLPFASALCARRDRTGRCKPLFSLLTTSRSRLHYNIGQGDRKGDKMTVFIRIGDVALKCLSTDGLALIVILLVSLIVGCSEQDKSAPVEKPANNQRIFDTQRSALEQAKEAAGSVNQRNRDYQKREK